MHFYSTKTANSWLTAGRAVQHGSADNHSSSKLPHQGVYHYSLQKVRTFTLLLFHQRQCKISRCRKSCIMCSEVSRGKRVVNSSTAYRAKSAPNAAGKIRSVMVCTASIQVSQMHMLKYGCFSCFIITDACCRAENMLQGHLIPMAIATACKSNMV